MLYLRPDSHSSEYQHGRAPAGRSAVGPTIATDVGPDGEWTVVLALDPLPAETFDDRDIDRTLTPAEARELAAMLWHHADAADRRAGLIR